MNFPVGGQQFCPSANIFGSRSYPMSSPARQYPCPPYPQSPSLSSPSTAILSTLPSTSPRRSSLPSCSGNESHLTPRTTNIGFLLTPPPSAIVERNTRAVISPANNSLLSGKAIFHDIKTYLRRYKDHAQELPLSLHIPNVPLAAFDDFLDTPALLSILGRSKLEYIASSSQIIIYAPPKPYHDCSPPFLHRVLQTLQRASFDTPARQDTLQVCENSWRAPNGSQLVPDAAVAVLDTESDETPRLWPTIVVEVANSQTYVSAVEKVSRWFRASEGMVEVALLLKFTEKEPLVNPACFIEVFRCRPPSTPGLDEGPEEPHSVITEQDTALEGDDNDGFDQDDGLAASDATSSEDEDDSLTSNSTSAAIDIQDDTALPENHSDSEHDASDCSATSSDSSDDSSSSDASYLPQKSPLILEIYQDGPRQIVLPAPPPDSGTQHIELQYSDFFGRENVPAARDPAEKVQLQLDLLRKELLVRLRLTQAQLGSLKRKGKAGEGLGVDKRVKQE